MTSLPSAPADEGSIAEMMRLLFALGRAPLEMVFQLCSATLPPGRVFFPSTISYFLFYYRSHIILCPCARAISAFD